MEGEGTPFRRVSLLPPNLPHPPRTSPMSPPFRKRRFVSLFESGGDMGEVFGGWGGGDFLQSAAVARFLWVGSVRFCKRCVGADLSPLISRLRDSFPPRGSLFARLPSHCITKRPNENMKYYWLHIYPLYIHCLRLYLLCMHGVKKASPWGGRKLQAVCRVSD